MKIKLENISKFISGVKSLAGNTPVIGVLMEVLDGEVRFIYSDSKKALYNSFDAEVDDSEKSIGAVVLEYNTLLNGLSQVQSSSSNIIINDIVLDLSSLSDNLIRASADKFMTFINGDETNTNLISNVEFFIKAYRKEEAGSKYMALTRFDYSTMIFGNSEYDTWETGDLVGIIKKLSRGDDGKSAYVSSIKQAGFIVNRNSLYYINSEAQVNIGFTATKPILKSLIDVINKNSTENLSLSVTDKRYCSIHSNNFGIWFEMAPFREIDGKMLNEYENNSVDNDKRAYNDIEVLLNREATLDMVRASQVGNKNDSDVLVIDYENSCLIFGDDKKGKSKLGVQLRHSSEVNKSTLGIIYKVWEDILSTCDGSYVKLGLELKDDNTAYLKFFDLDNEDTTKVNSVFYTIATERK